MSQGCTEKDLMDSRKFNTEAIDEIFENQNAKRFKCLDNEEIDDQLDNSKEEGYPVSQVNKTMSARTIQNFNEQMKVKKNKLLQ